MGLLWTEVMQSDLGAWFGFHEVSRTARPDGLQEVQLKPGGYEGFIDLELIVDEQNTVRHALLTLDRMWIDSGDTAPFADDLVKSALPVLAPENAAAVELGQRIAGLQRGHSLIVRESAVPPPLAAPNAELSAALESYLGRRERADVADKTRPVLLTNGLGNARQRLRIAFGEPVPDAVPETKTTDVAESGGAVQGVTFADLFLQPADLPDVMTMPEDRRDLGGFPDDPAFQQFGGLAAGLTRWHDPRGPAGRLIDIRWLFPAAATASGYHRADLQTNAEGLPPVSGTPLVGQDCRVYGGTFIDATEKALLGDKAAPSTRYLYLFTLGPVVAKLYIADVNNAGLSAADAGAIAQRAEARIAVALGPGARRGSMGRSWWQKLLGR